MTEGVPEKSIPPTPPEELQVIHEAQHVENRWWEHVDPVYDVEEMETLVREGVAVRVESDEVMGYKISENAPVEMNILRTEAHAILQLITEKWQAAVRDDTLFLVVTSLGRTVLYQKELQARGYPAADDSSHTKLAAFDISTKWFAEHRPEALQALINILKQGQDTDQINYIVKPTIGVVHVCVNPNAPVVQ